MLFLLGDNAKCPQSRGSSRTPRTKEGATPSKSRFQLSQSLGCSCEGPRWGTIGSAKVERRMQRKLNSSRKKESGPQTKHSSSETCESSINKESLRMSLEGSRRAPITSRNRTKATALVVPTNDEDPSKHSTNCAETEQKDSNLMTVW